MTHLKYMLHMLPDSMKHAVAEIITSFALDWVAWPWIPPIEFFNKDWHKWMKADDASFLVEDGDKDPYDTAWLCYEDILEFDQDLRCGKVVYPRARSCPFNVRQIDEKNYLSSIIKFFPKGEEKIFMGWLTVITGWMKIFLKLKNKDPDQLKAFRQFAMGMTTADSIPGSQALLRSFRGIAKEIEGMSARILRTIYSSLIKKNEFAPLLAIETSPCVVSQLDSPKLVEFIKKHYGGFGPFTAAIEWDWVNVHDIPLRELGEEVGPVLELFLSKLLQRNRVKIVEKSVKHGPAKTKSRCKAKSEEYEREKEDFVVKRAQELNVDSFWYARILDYARVSVSFPNATELVRAFKAIKNECKVVGVKNGYALNAKPPPSEYRDLKLLIWFSVEGQSMGSKAYNRNHGSRYCTTMRDELFVPEGAEMIVEIQLLLEDWLKNKKSSSLTYKIRRNEDWRTLAREFHKYFYSQTYLGV